MYSAANLPPFPPCRPIAGRISLFCLPFLFFGQLFLCFSASLLFAYAPESAKSVNLGLDAFGNALWLPLEKGLEFGEFRQNDQDVKLTALKIDPEFYEFVLCNSSRDESEPLTLEQWAERKNLRAAINASMYLPEKGISTGYMRSGAHVNNGRIVKDFGGFFLAGPREASLPHAQIIDREMPGFPALLDKYETVIQNYRMTDGNRHILWSPGGARFSISAIAQDGSGKILFLHSRLPVDVYSFVQQLLHLPLDIRTILYVEGGAQAGFFLKSPTLKRALTGVHAPSFLSGGNGKARLPNVLGIRPKAE